MRRVCAPGVFGLFALGEFAPPLLPFAYGLRKGFLSFRIVVAAVQPFCGRILFDA